mgnify:CR=1 FL=1
MDLNSLDHDIEDWDLWQQKPEFHWIFNKLELSLALGYAAGPCPALPMHEGYYIIRPIYNLYGMGLEASKVYLKTDDNSEIMRQQHPGSFWCEWFDGPHYSIDYVWEDAWKPVHATQGFSGEDFIHFDRWERIDPPQIELPPLLNKLANNKVLNIEFKDSKIIEVHLRLGNLAGDWYGLDDATTTIIPVWEHMTEFTIDQFKQAGFTFIDRPEDGSGKIENKRLGFLYK